MPEQVRITDVSPRDGLQNEPLRPDGRGIPAREKARLVRALHGAGVDEIEITSFVSPRWVPQLGDAEDLCRLVARERPAEIVHSALVPNERGLERALEANRRAIAEVGRRVVDKVSVFTAASETFSLRNTNASIAETLERFEPVRERAEAEGLLTRAYVSCVVACPYEGEIEPGAVALVAERLGAMGFDEIDLGETIGAGTPESIAAVLRAVIGSGACAGDPAGLTLHLHDTFGRAPACVLAALELGVRSFDASAGGLGGCPYASSPGARAPGNIATETLVRTIREAGYETGVNDEGLAEAGRIARELVAPGAGGGDGG